MAKTAQAYPLESVDRALRLITLLQDRAVITVTEAAAELDVVPSTAHRLLGALCFRGFAVQGADRQYRAGPAITTRRAYVTTAALRAAAGPALHALNRTFDETSHLMVMQGNAIQFVDGVEADRVLRVGLRVGGTMPAYCSAGGRAMLAALPPTDVDALHPDGLPDWPSAKLRGLNELRRELAAARKAGYAVQVEETEVGVAGAGAAVLDADGRPVAAITLAIPTARFDARVAAAMGRSLADAAAEVSARLLAPDVP